MLATVGSALLIVTGCGDDEEEASAPSRADQREQVVEIVKRLQTGVLDKDPGLYCDQLTGDGKRKLVATTAALGGATGCEGSARRVFDLNDVTIRGRRAMVRLDSGRQLKLSRSPAGWLVADPEAR